MINKVCMTALITTALLIATSADAVGQDEQSTSQTQSQGDDSVRGWQLMDERERQSYRKQMQALKTEDERHQLRMSQREKMQARARNQGASHAGPRSRDGGGNSQQGKGGGRSKGNRPAFTDFDTNSDGYLEEIEYGRGHAERIAAMAKEGRAMRNLGSSTFADIDTDSDGRVSPNEFAAHQARQHQGNQQRNHQE